MSILHKKPLSGAETEAYWQTRKLEARAIEQESVPVVPVIEEEVKPTPSGQVKREESGKPTPPGQVQRNHSDDTEDQ